MKKVWLTEAEAMKYRTIRNVVQGKSTKQRACITLDLSRRQINRLINVYLQQGKAGFVHGNAGREPANKLSATTAKKIIRLYTTKYEGFNIQHFHEFLVRDEQTPISLTSLRRLLRDNLVLSPKAHRTTKRQVRAAIKQKSTHVSVLSKRDMATLEATAEVAPEKAHPSRPRVKYPGELVQMDASKEYWYGKRKATLHIAIDDSSGSVVGATFAQEETLRGYYTVMAQILHDYGAPAKILTDRRTVFNYRRHQKEDSPSTENPLTKFGYACKTLGTELAVTSIPQAKGRVERLIETFQDRLQSEMRLAKVQTMTEANEFLKGFLKHFNTQFASPIKASMSVFDKQLSEAEIDKILIIASQRTVNSGHLVAFDNKRYLPLTEGTPAYLRPGTKVLVIKSLRRKMYMTTDNDEVYSLMCVPNRAFHSPQFDTSSPVAKPRRTHEPAITHPWRRMNYNDYLLSIGVSKSRARQLVNRSYPHKAHLARR